MEWLLAHPQDAEDDDDDDDEVEEGEATKILKTHFN
jgi:hypothetical protein